MQVSTSLFVESDQYLQLIGSCAFSMYSTGNIQQWKRLLYQVTAENVPWLPPSARGLTAEYECMHNLADHDIVA